MITFFNAWSLFEIDTAHWIKKKPRGYASVSAWCLNVYLNTDFFFFPSIFLQAFLELWLQMSSQNSELVALSSL